jgi:hypothetical protein
LKQLTSRKRQAVALAALIAAGIGAPLLTSSAAQAETGVVAGYSFTTDPASNLVDGQTANLTVANAGNPSALQSIEIHLCNTGAIDNQFDFSYDSGLCSPEPPGSFGGIDPFGAYGVPPGENSSSFTYTVASGTTPDGIVTCGPGASNCYLVYRVTNAAADEFYFGQTLTWAPPATTTMTTVPTTVPTTATTVPTTVPTTATTVPTTVPTTATTVPTTATTVATTATTVPTTVPTTATTVPTTATTVPTTATTVPTTATTVPTTATTKTTVSTTKTTVKPTTTKTTVATTKTTVKPTTTKTTVATTKTTIKSTTTRSTKPTTTTHPICQYKSQIPAWLWTIIEQTFGVTCP